jgi:hypothetical protein
MDKQSPALEIKQGTCDVCSALPFNDGRGRHERGLKQCVWIWETPKAVPAGVPAAAAAATAAALPRRRAHFAPAKLERLSLRENSQTRTLLQRRRQQRGVRVVGPDELHGFLVALRLRKRKGSVLDGQTVLGFAKAPRPYLQPHGFQNHQNGNLIRERVVPQVQLAVLR